MSLDPTPWTPEEQRARDAVRGLGAPEARPEFRERLRAAFSSGTIGAPSRRVVPLPSRLGPGLRRFVAVAAAGVAVVVALNNLNEGPRWTIAARHGDGVAIVDGRPVPLAHDAELRRVIRPGARIELPAGAELELVSAGVMALELSHGADVTVPVPPGRWFRRTSGAEARRGELRITTGARFHGAVLRIATLEAQVEVTGTTLAVICEPEGTCVCVLEGTVKVGEKAGPMVEVKGGMRRYVFNDARDPVTAVMRPEEHDHLPKFRAGVGFGP